MPCLYTTKHVGQLDQGRFAKSEPQRGGWHRSAPERGGVVLSLTNFDSSVSQGVQLGRPALLVIPGCGVLSAALIVGETAGVYRFRDKDAFAGFSGTAPVPVWSGSSHGKVRLKPGGNRVMNTSCT